MSAHDPEREGQTAAQQVVLTENMRSALEDHGFGAGFLNTITPEEEDLLPECPYDEDDPARDDWNTGFAIAMEERA